MRCKFCGAAKGTEHTVVCTSLGIVQLYHCEDAPALERRHTARLDEFDKEVATITFKRGEHYGPPRSDFERIQKFKALVAGCPDPAMRHVLEMIGVKMSRLCVTPTHLDSLIDIAGYARCGVMVSDDLLPGGSRYNKQPAASVVSAPAPTASDMPDLRPLLRLAKEKLQLYRAQHSGEYVGGVEFTDLMRRIDAALN